MDNSDLKGIVTVIAIVFFIFGVLSMTFALFGLSIKGILGSAFLLATSWFLWALGGHTLANLLPK